MAYSIRSLAQNPSSSMNIETDEYKGPSGGGTSYQSEYRTSAQHATAFKTADLGGGKPLGISSQTRGGVFSWDAGASTPGFNQNQ